MSMLQNTTAGQHHILVVDDEPLIGKMLKKAIENEGYHCDTATSGAEAITILDQKRVDVILADINMPRMSGIQLLTEVKAKYNAAVIIMTGYEIKDDAYTKLFDQLIEKGANDFIKKSEDYKEVVIRIKRVIRERKLISERDHANAKLNKSLLLVQKILTGTIDALASTVEIKIPYTTNHQQRVSKLSITIAQRMNLSKEQIGGIQTAGLLHDIGLLSVPFEILGKSDNLTSPEYEIIKNHTKIGYDVLKNIEFPWPIAKTILQHHERIDGSGYPSGIKGEEMLIESKVIGVADVLDAMSSHRPYRPALGMDRALQEISNKKRILFDPQIVEICLTLLKNTTYPI